MLAAFVARRRRVTTRSVLRAYREIGAVPLPRRTSSARRVGWVAAVLALGVGLATLGAPRLGWWPDWVAPGAHADRVAAPARTSDAVIALPGLAAPESSVAESAGVAVARAVPPEPAAVPPGPSAGELERRLASLDRQASARAAVETVLAAWRARPLASDEAAPDDLDRIAWRRGLEDLPLNGNQSMLRLLDVPAILELRVGADGVRYAALTGTEEGKVVLAIAGTPVTIDAGLLDHFWFGQAHVLWRDFEGLGPAFGQEVRGVRLTRLQTLLNRAGAYDGPPTGEWDPRTTTAVLDFQRSRRLVVDGRVGRLTRIVLYAAAGGYPRPTLAAAGGAS